jgi:hypothetical protein
MLFSCTASRSWAVPSSHRHDTAHSTLPYSLVLAIELEGFKTLHKRFPFYTYCSAVSFPTHLPLDVWRQTQGYGKWVVFKSLAAAACFQMRGIICLLASAESFTVKPVSPQISKWLLSFHRRLCLAWILRSRSLVPFFSLQSPFKFRCNDCKSLPALDAFYLLTFFFIFLL